MMEKRLPLQQRTREKAYETSTSIWQRTPSNLKPMHQIRAIIESFDQDVGDVPGDIIIEADTSDDSNNENDAANDYEEIIDIPADPRVIENPNADGRAVIMDAILSLSKATEVSSERDRLLRRQCQSFISLFESSLQSDPPSKSTLNNLEFLFYSPNEYYTLF